MASHASPDIRNYTVGKGIAYFKKTGDTVWRDLGNVPLFDFTPNITTLDHFSSRQGVKLKDRTVVLEKSGTLKMDMEEFTAKNLAMAILGTVTTNSAGREVIDIFGSSAVSGEMKFHGTNDVGPRFEWHFLKVDFVPGQSVSLLSDGWGVLQIQGDVSAVNGSFGTVTQIGDEDSESE